MLWYNPFRQKMGGRCCWTDDLSETINDTVAAIPRGADGRARLVADVCRFGFLSPHGWYCYNWDFLTTQFEEAATDDDTATDDDLNDDIS